ncbi:caspase, EACC1-associated type [Streptomyces natalensis]|uniref:caspase, EACC1-associated type n=1 Tax=Streptomyces natalensis TaxID=68242 RepID=UPI00068A846C|nr:caspase family protein [Streptomyces natalensis]
MTDTVPLRDYSRSRAVLIGAWDYAHLTPVPAARNSLERVAGLLTGPLCGWPKPRVKALRNVRRRDHLPDQLMKLFDGVEDVALFYFVGHGQLYEDELCLALRESPQAGPRRTTVGLPFSDVRAALRACDAQTKIVILDCCFAGHAARTEHTLASTSTNVIDKTLGTGAVTMAASGAYRTAWFESAPDVAAPQTYFTKYLVDVIEQGIPGHPQGLPLGPIYARTADALARDHRPEPTRSVRHDADRFILARNIAKPPESPAALPETPTASPSRDRDTTPPNIPAPSSPSPDSGAESAVPTARRGPSRRSIVLGGIATLATTSGAVLIGLRLANGGRDHESRDNPSSHPSAGGHRPSDPPSPHPWFSITNTTGTVTPMTFSPDGKTLAGSDSDNTIGLWDIAARKHTGTLTSSTKGVHALAFSPDGNTLATGYDDKTVRLWDVAARKSIATLTGHTGPVMSVVFSHDGKTLTTACNDNTVRLWDVTALRSITTLTSHAEPHAKVNLVALSPDGKTLISVSYDQSIRLWDVTDQQGTVTLTGHTSAESVALSPDGKTLATGCWDRTVRLWDVAARKSIAALSGHTSAVDSVAFSPDGKTLASAGSDGLFNYGDPVVRLWDVAARKSIAALSGHTSPVDSVAFSPDGKTLASASSDHTIRLWKLT